MVTLLKQMMITAVLVMTVYLPIYTHFLKKITFNLIAPHDKHSFFVHTRWNKVHTELLFFH